MRVKFVLLTEGSSDRALLPHLEDLCERAGATEVEGIWPDLREHPNRPGKRVEEQLHAILRMVPGVCLVFIHRDADRRDDALARRDITRGVAAVESCPPHVKVVPIQEMEAWLLTDEAAIREVARNPGGKVPLGLPPLSRIELTASPKKVLEQALVSACKLKGRQLRDFKRSYSRHRAILMSRLDIDGPVRQLSAWQRLVEETTTAVQSLMVGANGVGGA